MLIKEVMTSSPVSCKPTDTVDRVAALMAEHDCGVIPVVEGRKVVGMITDRDVTCRVVATGKAPASVAVRDVMTKPVYAVRQDENVQSAIDLMEAKQVRRLPVLDDRGNIAGIIAPSDLAPTFASMDVADFLLAVSYWTRKPIPV
ncbi:MAG TPA: CBS domain-containing protein [Thermoanaerobaculia bacterium]|nr:CBS domain-containing protein [Thermoanaerobaculia bacterium]